MREKFKNIIRGILGDNFTEAFLQKAKKNRSLFYLLTNTYSDFRLYYQYSTLFKLDNLKKEEALLILDYHSIEKGMLYLNMKPRFAQNRVERIHKYLKSENLLENLNRTQIEVTLKVMCKYYEIHQEKNINIEDYFSQELYEKYKLLLKNNYVKEFSGAIDSSYEDFYQNASASFDKFAISRKSIRTYTGEKVKPELIEKAISLSLTAPSVCNRQANTVYLLEDKEKIDKVLKIQGGFTGYEEKVSQLLILTNNRNYYYTVGERNQFYIDGGVFLLNLLYSLHFYNIASCPANWGKMVKDEKELDKIISIPKSEKIICLIPIGIATANFRVTLSKRRNVEETLKKLQ
ncbi:nitroreductase family protein [Salegentibacter salegens]|uniref:Nitroreductase n=1 Tax=Salegentibacter salegens TaxID=143223 RepID=A0A1M7ILP4_9FLAO|nr:nitroreductase family protein [Salegentibacter salegens]PRX42478.1 nitroreductase [Salegentibacter salegens]SHM41736.1 Nitroreductase [Salegentibacter salegens]